MFEFAFTTLVFVMVIAYIYFPFFLDVLLIFVIFYCIIVKCIALHAGHLYSYIPIYLFILNTLIFRK